MELSTVILEEYYLQGGLIHFKFDGHVTVTSASGDGYEAKEITLALHLNAKEAFVYSVEAEEDYIDILLSFPVLPVATILKLFTKSIKF